MLLVKRMRIGTASGSAGDPADAGFCFFLFSIRMITGGNPAGPLQHGGIRFPNEPAPLTSGVFRKDGRRQDLVRMYVHAAAQERCLPGRTGQNDFRISSGGILWSIRC
jgi:hypothetical protein